MSAEFVAHMEDVLDLYAEPYDPQRPVVCFDETSTQLLADTRPPLLAQPGRPARQDSSTCFWPVGLLAGGQSLSGAHAGLPPDALAGGRGLAARGGPGLVDNLNTHRKASLYGFPAAEARRIAKRLEFHYTPKHGSWLNMESSSALMLPEAARPRRTGPAAGGPGLGHGEKRRPSHHPGASAFSARTKLHRLIPNMTDY